MDYFLVLVIILGVSLTNGEPRQKRLFSVFNIIRFPNDPCVSQDNKNGTCYTTDECTTLRGKASGSCAQGYGTCCTFSLGCGQTSSENTTYFESTAGTAGDCMATICPAGLNICQIRLDFNQFQITGPSTSAVTIANQLHGMVNLPGATQGVTYASQCLTDTFSVMGGTNPSPPTICGTNKDQHMYVNVDGNACIKLMMSLGTTAVGTSMVQRRWSMKATQYSCDYSNLAPSGCTQYFFEPTASVQSFNFQGGQHLANQNQVICVRREQTNCRICWTAANVADFMTSGMSAMGFAQDDKCCAYDANGKGVHFDCVVIPGALNVAMTSLLGNFYQFCGRSAGLVAANMDVAANAKTICFSCMSSWPWRAGSKPGNGIHILPQGSRNESSNICYHGNSNTPLNGAYMIIVQQADRQPFQIRFSSDGFEFPTEVAPATGGPNAGFKLIYTQTNKGCAPV